MDMYQIETLNANGWNADGIGDNNEFQTRSEASEAIEALRQLGSDWATATYRVVEVAFDDDYDEETNTDGVDTYHAWDCEGDAFDDCGVADTYEAWIDGARDDSVIFSVYPGEDIVEAGASALGVCVSEALNTKQVTA